MTAYVKATLFSKFDEVSKMKTYFIAAYSERCEDLKEKLKSEKWSQKYNAVVFSMAQQPLLGQDLLIIEASRHTPSHHIPLEEASVRRRVLYLTTHNIRKRRHTCLFGIRTRNHSKRAAGDLNLRARAHRDRQIIYCNKFI